MPLSRRELLGAGGTALAVALAGCVGGPSPYTSLSVGIREPFAAEPPVVVPLDVEVRVQNVDEPAVALRGVSIACYDAERTPLATQRLGDFARQDAGPRRRDRREYDRTIGTTTVYSATWRPRRDVLVEEVPQWIGFRVEGVEFGSVERTDDGEAVEGSTERRSPPVGTARASQPAPELVTSVLGLSRDRELGEVVGPDDYRSHRVERESAEGRTFGAEERLLPDGPARQNRSAR